MEGIVSQVWIIIEEAASFRRSTHANVLLGFHSLV